MTNKLKYNFKSNNDVKKLLNFKINGTKAYLNAINDVGVKSPYKFNKYFLMYNYKMCINSFRTFTIKSIILDKKLREHMKFIKYFNIFNNNLLFLKKNEL